MMLNSVDFSGRPFHFIGIGGIGMSALAYVLTQRKLPVSGSDLSLNHITKRLQEQGAHIFWSQDATNLEAFRSGVPLSDLTLQPQVALLPQVVCSTAIGSANAEYRAAIDLGCPIFHRSDLLAALMREYRGIAVAGTHGKTTTSSMIGFLLLKAGLDPTIVVGGEVTAWEGNARTGQSDYLVAEADESDGSLVKLAAEIGIITNIELDHPDHYTTLDEVIATFQTFAGQCQTLIGCLDSPIVRQVLQPQIGYSVRSDADANAADYTVAQVIYQADGTSAQVYERGVLLGQLQLPLLGEHNLSNALAAIAVGRLLGLEFAQIAAILSGFEGAKRRFERRGEYNQILFIDDYAHHPSEIQATLAAARLRAQAGSQRVVAVFQPHRYSRTLTFLKEFAESFRDADLVVTTDIYSAGEPNTGQVTGQQLAEAIATHHSEVVYQPTLADVEAHLKTTLRPGDLVMFLGAGNLNRMIPDLMTFCQHAAQQATCYSPDLIVLT
jgi:UDP-N-acetylmuramate--alanine ligase